MPAGRGSHGGFELLSKEPEDDGEEDAEEDAGDDGEVEAGVAAGEVDVAGELALRENVLDRGELVPLRRAITAYHRRRQRQTPLILEAMHRRARAEQG